MGEPSVARLLATSRVVRPYPPDRVLNAAGNSAIGLNAGRAEFQMRATVAVWQHAWRTDSASRWAGRRHSARRAARGRIRKPGTLSAGADCRSSRFCNPVGGTTTRRARARLPRERERRAQARRLERGAGGSSCEMGPWRVDDAVDTRLARSTRGSEHLAQACVALRPLSLMRIFPRQRARNPHPRMRCLFDFTLVDGTQ